MAFAVGRVLPVRCGAFLMCRHTLSSISQTVCPGLTISLKDGVRTVVLDKPDKFNAFSWDMFKYFPKLLTVAAEDDATRVVAITGRGKYYSSGNDLGNFKLDKETDMRKMAESAGEILHTFVGAFIDFPKPLVSVVNGPALGIACSTLALCDAVYASDLAAFQTPFTKIGQAPEACSSFTFPRIMGHSLANEMLLFNKMLSSQEAKRCGLVSDVFSHLELTRQSEERLASMAQLPPKSMRAAKKLVRDVDRAVLHKVNREECELLVNLWQSEECLSAIAQFFKRK